MTTEYTPSLEKDCTVVVSRFDSRYPLEDPTSFVVGFSAICNKNGRTKYADVCIEYSEIKGEDPEEEVLQLAWSRLKDSFDVWLASVYYKSSVLGRVFNP